MLFVGRPRPAEFRRRRSSSGRGKAAVCGETSPVRRLLLRESAPKFLQTGSPAEGRAPGLSAVLRQREDRSAPPAAASSPFPESHGAESEGENVFLPPCRLHIIQIFEENQEEIITSFSSAFVRIYKKCTFHIFSVFDVLPLRVVCFLRQATSPVFTAF